MRVVIAGQKRFGRDVLDLVCGRGWEVACVFCPDDAGDKLRIGAMNRRLPLFSERMTADLLPAGVELIVAAHCHTFISSKARDRAELGALGFHPSLLPRHRGRSAVEWVIRFGERVTGGTVFWLNETVDGGPIAAQDHCFIQAGDTARELWARELAPMGLRLFGQVFDELDRGVKRAVPQDPALATWEPAVDKVPPLWRPDVPQLGSSRFQVVTVRAGEG